MSRWTLGKRIAFGLLLVLAQALSVGVYALWMTVQTAHKLDRVSSEYLPEMQLASRLERDLFNARIHFIYFVTIQKDGSLSKGWPFLQDAADCLPKLQTLVNGSREFADLRPEVIQLQHDFDSYQPALRDIIQMVERGEHNSPQFKTALTAWASLGTAMVTSAGRLNSSGLQVTGKSAMQASSREAIAILASACLAGLLVGLGLTIFVTKDIKRTLCQLISELSKQADGIAEASRQVTGIAQPLAKGASQQAASLEETSSSTEQIHSMAIKNANHSKSAAANIARTNERVNDANRNLEGMTRAMEEIQASSSKILKILKVIDSIAFQTNILALNAAVEAARAGEAGLGFAVVADEVRSLAQRCTQAAKDTSELIGDSIHKSKAGKSSLDEVATAIQAITEGATEVKNLVDDVTLGSDEQQKGIALVVKAILQMEEVTQTTSAHAQESAVAGEQLNVHADSLHVIVQQFSVFVLGVANLSSGHPVGRLKKQIGTESLVAGRYSD